MHTHVVQSIKERLGHGGADRDKRIKSRQGLPRSREPRMTTPTGAGEGLGVSGRGTGSRGLDGGGAHEGGGRGGPQTGGEGLDLRETVFELRVLEQGLSQHQLLVGEQSLSLLSLCSLSHYTLCT